ncbi:YeeE/YedE family protein [Lichenicola cladoniae]|uniref:YeeE/YedE family protein n=2 Tax=Lichenicola cladoniae TaxID=1484109 RepID=A0A6M8HWI1_9PROT|nr:YeeE/YedE thiosulfate transporter family protein [Lichenicola cladoniae]NPD70082.1 YeeE/YedE family protein [Acetobacteraceae bacterium]QKE92421.1 YeeE/YedE family protein [Lichenicola cladoniae]
MPLQGLIGGAMIGLASALMLLGLGRIAGVSGMAARASGLAADGAPWSWAMAFVVGLPLGAALIAAIVGPVETHLPGSPAILAVGGLVVGFGTRLGNGCTSGHGVCGVSRRSLRSIVATAVFMIAGIATVALMHLLGVAA